MISFCAGADACGPLKVGEFWQMFILGAGAAYPGGELTDDFLASLGVSPSAADRAALARFGVRSRRSVLPHAYLSSTKNSDVVEARKVSSDSPTSLAVAAAHQALAQAGITPDQLGLIIADCATPYQTCPSEAQRIGGALKLKVPAYDVTAGIGALALSLDMLSSWKPERMPDYVLCISTNTPTELVSYAGSPLAAALFGDAASAVLISAKVAGKLRLKSSFLSRDQSVRAPISLVRAASIDFDRLMPEGLLRDRISAGILHLGAVKSSYLIGPQLFAGDTACIASALDLPSDRVISVTAEKGYSLGASSGCSLASLWPALQKGDQVACLHEGDGISGGVLLEAAA